VIIGLLAYNLNKTPPVTTVSDNEEETYITLEAISIPPPGRNPPPFEMGEVGFYTDDPNIKMIEVNQGLSYGFDTDTGEFFLIEDFTAGKETGIFVVLENPISGSSEITLTVYRDGEVVGVLLPAKIVDQRTILFQPRDMAEFDDWEQGAYAFVFNIDGSEAKRVTNFIQSIQVKVLAVPMISNYGGKVVSCTEKWRESSQMLVEAFPVAKHDVEFVYGPELDLSDNRFDLNTERGRYNVWKSLRALQTPDEEYTLIIGFMPQALYNYQRNATWMGYTYRWPANIVCESEVDLISTVVHEVSHCYFIGDEYPGGVMNEDINAPPYLMEGIDMFTGGGTHGTKDTVVRGSDYGIPGSGSVIYPEQRAYRVHDRTLLGTVSSYMGFALGEDPYNRWISSEMYLHLFDSFTGKSVWGMPTGSTYLFGQCPECYMNVYDPKWIFQCKNCFYFTGAYDPVSCENCGERSPLSNYTYNDVYVDCDNCWNLIPYYTFMDFNKGDDEADSKNSQSSSGLAAADPNELIMVTDVKGYFDTDGTFVAEPWYSYPAPHGSLTANRNSEYSVCVYDAKGKKIAVTFFDLNTSVQANTVGDQFYVEDAFIPIDLRIKYLEDAAKIVIQKGDEEIYTRVVSKNAPKVSFTGVTVDKNNNDIVTVSWDATDQDGDELYFELYYCLGQEEYWTVATDITERSFTIDLSRYPGTDAGYFYIYATDGINTAETNSDYFTVAFTAPVIIADNSETIRCNITGEIYFDPKAYDSQDGYLDFGSVEWLDNGVPYEVSGTLWIMPYQVEPGMHTFTCVATNSAGVSTTKDFKVEIAGDESDLPDDWTRDYVRYALQHGIYLPLDRLDAPVTRSQFARQMAFVYGSYSTLPGIYPSFNKDEYVTDCGQANLCEAMMVYLGVMSAPDGNFEPQRSMTELEGTLMMYIVSEMADKQNVTIDDFDEDEVIQLLYEWGVLENEGPDVFEPDKKLTGKTLMVRIAKMFRYDFGD